MTRMTIPHKLDTSETVYALVCNNCASFATCSVETNCLVALIRRIGELEDLVEKYERKTQP